MTVITPTFFTLLVATGILAQQPAPAVGVKQFNDGAYWIVIEPFAYQIGNSKLIIEVPRGFVTDYASIPKGLTAASIPTGR